MIPLHMTTKTELTTVVTPEEVTKAEEEIVAYFEQANTLLARAGFGIPISMIFYTVEAFGGDYTDETSKFGRPALNFDSILGVLKFANVEEGYGIEEKKLKAIATILAKAGIIIYEKIILEPEDRYQHSEESTSTPKLKN